MNTQIAFNNEIRKGLMKDTITIDRELFRKILDDLYLYIPKDRIKEVENMFEERNRSLKIKLDEPDDEIELTEAEKLALDEAQAEELILEQNREKHYEEK
jgi:hypothetical protein